MASQPTLFRFKRGAFANLPGLQGGEPGFTTDKYDFYIGLTSETSTNKFFGSSRYWEREDGTSSLYFKLVDKDGSNSINLKSPDTLSGIVTYTLPGTQGSSSSLLINDGSGGLTWGTDLDNISFSGISTFSQSSTLNVFSNSVSIASTVGISSSVYFGDDDRIIFDNGQLSLYSSSDLPTISMNGGSNGGFILLNGDSLSIKNGSHFATDVAIFNADTSVELYYASSKKFETTEDGITVDGSTTSTSFIGPLTGNVTGNVIGNVTGNLTGHADSAGISTFTAEWTLGADGSDNYTFTGPGLTGAENDPTIYVHRGEKYKFTNNMGAHPFQIQREFQNTSGTAYNDGITNNGVSNGTLEWDVQFDSPDVLYYQCTSHQNMSGKIEVVTAGIGTAGSVNTTGIITASAYYGDGSNLSGIDPGQSALGDPDDGAHSGVLGITSSTKIVNAIDDLNELTLNLLKNTAVANVDFTSDSVAGGSPLSITLTTSADGNPNRYTINWGDGNTDTDSTDSTPSHTYSDSNGGQFSITLTARNNSGVGAGSSSTKTRTNYITLYTPDPVVSFELYRNSSGGSAISGNDLYVVEGNSLYLDNNTTNTSGATVDYTINWGDGSSNDSIASDSADGGVSGSRLQHTWDNGTNSGTGRDTLTLTLNNHNTADPSAIPTSGTVTLKVYDDAPTAPDGLSSKTLSNVSSTGTSPKLAHGFSDNVSGGTSLNAGDSVTRVTGGTAVAGPITTFAYSGDSGTLTAKVNNSGDGTKSLSSGDDSGTYTSLIIDSESDYQLLNSEGSTTSFASSIYYPGLYKGFKARVSKSVSSLSTGACSMQLSHSATGDTNIVNFVKDNLTSTPTVNIGSATLSQNVAGTFRYISGIPYYNSGSPSLTLSGVTIDNLVGQCYTNQSNIVEVDDGTNQESTSSNAITNTDYTYANIDGSTTMLSSGIPKANTGTSSAYSIGALTVPITSSSVRTISRVKVRSRNVNGTSSYSSDISTNIQVHKSAQSGISEIAIAVSDSLGSTYDDDGVRIFDFSSSTTNNPSYNNSTNFYTNSTYSESSDPGVSGTKEATVRLGVIKYDVTDYSTGYLPVGPDRSGDTGTQYFTFAFRRVAVAGFDINITSSGIAGLWIAAPGTSIDSSSTLNGWLRTDQAYDGSGVPGADTGNGGNGSNGCAATSGDVIASSTSLSGSFTMTLGTENMSNATGNVVLVRIALTSGQSVTSLSIS